MVEKKGEGGKREDTKREENCKRGRLAIYEAELREKGTLTEKEIKDELDAFVQCTMA